MGDIILSPYISHMILVYYNLFMVEEILWRSFKTRQKVEKLQGGLPRVSRQCKYGLWITKWLINAMIVVVLYQSKYLSILKHRKIDYNCGNWLFKDVQSESSICLCRTQLYTYCSYGVRRSGQPWNWVLTVNKSLLKVDLIINHSLVKLLIPYARWKFVKPEYWILIGSLNLNSHWLYPHGSNIYCADWSTTILSIA